MEASGHRGIHRKTSQPTASNEYRLIFRAQVAFQYRLLIRLEALPDKPDLDGQQPLETPRPQPPITAPRAFFMTSVVTQRDTGTIASAFWATGSSRAQVIRTAAATPPAPSRARPTTGSSARRMIQAAFLVRDHSRPPGP